MTEDSFPGVFVEEVSYRARAIEGVSTKQAAVVGAILVFVALVCYRRHRRLDL
jgi:phage tail sheath protein FI